MGKGSSGERPAFEVTDLKGRTYRIWASGRIEGFEDMRPCVIINRIPLLLEAERQRVDR